MNTDVPGSPGSCRATAEALDRLARQLERADRLTASGARTSERDFDGCTADAYRSVCAGLAADAAAHAASAHRAAGALAAYGEELAAVQRVMQRVRASAGVHGLLQGTELVPPAAPTPHQDAVLDRLSAIAADALAHLERARDRLSAAFPGQPFPADYADVLLPPSGEPAGPVPFPPPDSAWPADQPPDERHPDRARRDGDGPDRDARHEARPDAEDAPDAPRGTEGGDDAAPPREPAPREVGPEPTPRIREGGPVGPEGCGDPEWGHLPGPVLRPVPEPVP